ncbi:unnamed protein product [Discosporangium mesarthrocarpum]
MTPQQTQSMIPAREGRELQRWEGNTRLLAGCLPLLADGKVLLIRSRKRDEWILPKGGWELDETVEQAAAREAYEEAGVRGLVGQSLGTHELLSNGGKYCRMDAFVLHVSEVLEDWPESYRERKTVSGVDSSSRQGPFAVLCSSEAMLRVPPGVMDQFYLIPRTLTSTRYCCPGRHSLSGGNLFCYEYIVLAGPSVPATAPH